MPPSHKALRRLFRFMVLPSPANGWSWAARHHSRAAKRTERAPRVRLSDWLDGGKRCLIDPRDGVLRYSSEHLRADFFAFVKAKTESGQPSRRKVRCEPDCGATRPSC